MNYYLKSITNEDHNNAQSRKSGTDTVKFASVIGIYETNIVSMCIMAVWISCKSSRKMVKTYEVLHNCSQRCFIKEDIIEELGITGRKHKVITLKLVCSKKADEHYDMLLPYRDGNLQLLKSKNQSIRAIQQLMRSFQRDPELFNSYVKQIEELLLERYAKQSSIVQITAELL